MPAVWPGPRLYAAPSAPRPGDTWHLDEVLLRIGGRLLYLWRAVDQHGVVLDILVQDRRNASAAKRFFKRLLTGLQYGPKHLSITVAPLVSWRVHPA